MKEHFRKSTGKVGKLDGKNTTVAPAVQQTIFFLFFCTYFNNSLNNL